MWLLGVAAGLLEAVVGCSHYIHCCVTVALYFLQTKEEGPSVRKEQEEGRRYMKRNVLQQRQHQQRRQRSKVRGKLLFGSVAPFPIQIPPPALPRQCVRALVRRPRPFRSEPCSHLME